MKASMTAARMERCPLFYGTSTLLSVFHWFAWVAGLSMVHERCRVGAGVRV